MRRVYDREPDLACSFFPYRLVPRHIDININSMDKSSAHPGKRQRLHPLTASDIEDFLSGYLPSHIREPSPELCNAEAGVIVLRLEAFVEVIAGQRVATQLCKDILAEHAHF